MCSCKRVIKRVSDGQLSFLYIAFTKLKSWFFAYATNNYKTHSGCLKFARENGNLQVLDTFLKRV